MENLALLNLPDEILHMTVCGGMARVLLLRTTAMTRDAAQIHQPSDTAMAAMSRLMTATSMLGCMMKGEKDSVTVTVAGNGPAGKITCVANGTKVKIALQNPQVELPLKQDGHLNVGGYIGHEGRLTVVKDLGLKEPYVGQCQLVSGELGEDFAHYYTTSEQKPSIVALGCLVNNGTCLSAGGALIQPLPGCPDDVLDLLEIRAMFFTTISREVAEEPLEDLATKWFDGMDLVILEKEPVCYQCDCSREKMEKALIAMGRRDLNELIEEDEGAELTCHFCRTSHQFTKEDLIALMERATR